MPVWTLLRDGVIAFNGGICDCVGQRVNSRQFNDWYRMMVVMVCWTEELY